MRSTIVRFAVGLSTSLSGGCLSFAVAICCRVQAWAELPINSCGLVSLISVSSVVQSVHGWIQNERNQWEARNRRQVSMRPTILAELLALKMARSNLALADALGTLW